MELLMPYMENRKRSANIFDSDDKQSDNADTEVSKILETQTLILANNYVLEEDNGVQSNKEREDSVKKLNNTPLSTGRKFTFKEQQKKKNEKK